MDETDPLGLRRMAEVSVVAERLLGARGWALLRSYGRLMCGPHSGSYVSSRPLDEQLGYVHRLLEGESLDIHLMHRHRSGNYESSSLQLREGVLVMVFDDRIEVA